MRVDKNKLLLAMANACMNAYDLCAASGVKYQTFQKVKYGNNAKPATVGKLAKALGVPVTDIIKDEE